MNLPQTVKGDLIVIPTVSLYNRARVFRPSEAELMAPRIPAPFAEINAVDADKLGISDGDLIAIDVDGTVIEVAARVNADAPQGAILLPRHLATGVAVPLVPAVGQVRELVR